MKIALISPLSESVPPRMYGGTERVVSFLAESLVADGHDVTLFASGQSMTAGNLVSCCAEPLRWQAAVRDIIPYYMIMLDKVRRMSSQFDILHFHIDQFHFPLFRDVAHKTVTTLHGRQDLPDLANLYRAFPEMPLVSISNSQRVPVPDANYVATIYHGLPASAFQPCLRPTGGYLAFLGRISPEKGIERAIRIARHASRTLKIAAKVDAVDADYFATVVKPLLGPDIQYIGEIDDHHKAKFLGQADALLFPIDWPEPFGLAMIEAMACGTPVLAFRRGSVPEVIDEGITGHVVDDEAQAHAAIERVIGLDRAKVYARSKLRFSAQRMARAYVALFEAQLEKAGALRRRARFANRRPDLQTE